MAIEDMNSKFAKDYAQSWLKPILEKAAAKEEKAEAPKKNKLLAEDIKEDWKLRMSVMPVDAIADLITDLECNGDPKHKDRADILAANKKLSKTEAEKKFFNLAPTNFYIDNPQRKILISSQTESISKTAETEEEKKKTETPAEPVAKAEAPAEPEKDPARQEFDRVASEIEKVIQASAPKQQFDFNHYLQTSPMEKDKSAEVIEIRWTSLNKSAPQVTDILHALAPVFEQYKFKGALTMSQNDGEGHRVNVVPIWRPSPAKPTQASLEVYATIVQDKGKWVVKSKKGKVLGSYATKAEALKRLRQVEYFKHHKGSISKKAIEIEQYHNYSGEDQFPIGSLVKVTASGEHEGKVAEVVDVRNEIADPKDIDSEIFSWYTLAGIDGEEFNDEDLEAAPGMPGQSSITVKADGDTVIQIENLNAGGDVAIKPRELPEVADGEEVTMKRNSPNMMSCPSCQAEVDYCTVADGKCPNCGKPIIAGPDPNGSPAKPTDPGTGYGGDRPQGVSSAPAGTLASVKEAGREVNVKSVDPLTLSQKLSDRIKQEGGRALAVWQQAYDSAFEIAKNNPGASKKIPDLSPLENTPVDQLPDRLIGLAEHIGSIEGWNAGVAQGGAPNAPAPSTRGSLETIAKKIVYETAGAEAVADDMERFMRKLGPKKMPSHTEGHRFRMQIEDVDSPKDYANLLRVFNGYFEVPDERKEWMGREFFNPADYYLMETPPQKPAKRQPVEEEEEKEVGPGGEPAVPMVMKEKDKYQMDTIDLRGKKYTIDLQRNRLVIMEGGNVMDEISFSDLTPEEKPIVSGKIAEMAQHDQIEKMTPEQKEKRNKRIMETDVEGTDGTSVLKDAGSKRKRVPTPDPRARRPEISQPKDAEFTMKAMFREAMGAAGDKKMEAREFLESLWGEPWDEIEKNYKIWQEAPDGSSERSKIDLWFSKGRAQVSGESSKHEFRTMVPGEPQQMFVAWVSEQKDKNLDEEAEIIQGIVEGKGGSNARVESWKGRKVVVFDIPEQRTEMGKKSFKDQLAKEISEKIDIVTGDPLSTKLQQFKSFKDIREHTAPEEIIVGDYGEAEAGEAESSEDYTYRNPTKEEMQGKPGRGDDMVFDKLFTKKTKKPQEKQEEVPEEVITDQDVAIFKKHESQPEGEALMSMMTEAEGGDTDVQGFLELALGSKWKDIQKQQQDASADPANLQGPWWDQLVSRFKSFKATQMKQSILSLAVTLVADHEAEHGDHKFEPMDRVHSKAYNLDATIIAIDDSKFPDRDIDLLLDEERDGSRYIQVHPYDITFVEKANASQQADAQKAQEEEKVQKERYQESMKGKVKEELKQIQQEDKVETKQQKTENKAGKLLKAVGQYPVGTPVVILQEFDQDYMIQVEGQDSYGWALKANVELKAQDVIVPPIAPTPIVSEPDDARAKRLQLIKDLSEKKQREKQERSVKEIKPEAPYMGEHAVEVPKPKHEEQPLVPPEVVEKIVRENTGNSLSSREFTAVKDALEDEYSRALDIALKQMQEDMASTRVGLPLKADLPVSAVALPSVFTGDQPPDTGNPKLRYVMRDPSKTGGTKVWDLQQDASQSGFPISADFADEHGLGGPAQDKEKLVEDKELHDVDPKELAMGVEVEREHAPTIKKIKDSIKDNIITMSDDDIYKSIALDHLLE